MGFGWVRVFHLRQEAAIPEPDGGGNSHDHGVLFRRFCLVDVPGLLGNWRSGLFLGEEGVLRISANLNLRAILPAIVHQPQESFFELPIRCPSPSRNLTGMKMKFYPPFKDEGEVVWWGGGTIDQVSGWQI